jgi:hypothetical protein
MRRRLILAALGVIVVVAAGLALATRGGDDDPAAAVEAGLEARTVSSGEIDIEIEPRQLDDERAVFAITLDTHSVELSADLTRATLEVDGISWPVEVWSGDGPGGHHREGDLRFASNGAATGTARLALQGFSEPVEVTWEIEG